MGQGSRCGSEEDHRRQQLLLKTRRCFVWNVVAQECIKGRVMNMRMNLLVAISFSALVCLGGCAYTSAYTGEPSGEPPSQDGVYDRLISDNQTEIVQKAQAFIHERHPVIEPGFPNIHIRSVSVEGAPQEDSEVAGVLQSLNAGILGTRPNLPTWEVDVKVDFHFHEPSDTTKALTVGPEVVICLGTIFIVCPAHYTEEVVMEVQATLPDGSQVQFASAGYAELYESTALLESDDQRYKDKITERNTAGLIAAIVGSADKFVATYHSLSKQ